MMSSELGSLLFAQGDTACRLTLALCLLPFDFVRRAHPPSYVMYSPTLDLSLNLHFPVPPRRGGPSRDHSCPACSRPDRQALGRLSKLDEPLSTDPALSRPGSSAGSLDGWLCGKSHGLRYGWRCSWLCPFRSLCPVASVPFDQLIDQLSDEHLCGPVS